MAKKKAVPPLKLSENLVPQGPFHYNERRFHLFFTLLVIISCFVLYGSGISNGYSLDDEFVMHNDSIVQKGVKGIPALFKSRYAWDQKGSYGYRPIVKLTFATEYQFFGFSTRAGHIINITLYAILVISLFYFLRKMLYNEVSDHFLLIAVALFLAHPIHTEVVDSLKNRDAILSCLFGLLSSYAFIKCFEVNSRLKQTGWIIIACIAFQLGFLAKPDALLFIAITPLIVYFFIRKSIPACGVIIVSTVLSGKLRNMIIKSLLANSVAHRTYMFYENPLFGTHWYNRIKIGFESIWFYISKLMFPENLVSYYGYDEFHSYPKWMDIEVLLGIVITAAFVWLIFKRINKRDVWLFSLLLLTGTIFVFINILKLSPGIVAERFMFIPSIGFVLCAALLLYKIFKTSLFQQLKWKNSNRLLATVGLIAIVYSARVIARNPDWKSHLSIYEHDARIATRSAKLQSLLGAAYIDEIKKNHNLTSEEVGNYYQLAEAAFKASVIIYPEYTTSLNNIGLIEYMYYKNMDTALVYFNKAIKYDSTYTEAWFNAASAYRELNNFPMAEKMYLHTIKISPDYDMTYTSLSRLYSAEGKYDEVLKLNEEAVKKGHATDAIYINIGKIYMMRGDTTDAVDYFNKALKYFDKNQKLCEWLANYYFKKKDTVKAHYYLKLKNAADNFIQSAVKRQ